MRFQPGDTIGSYRVTGYIGEGAAGVVYQVVNSVTGRLDAMKVLTDSIGQDLEQRRQFLREIQLHAKLDHPNIAQVHTAFCEGSTIVLVMELVDGEPLSAILSRGPLPPPTAVRVAGQLLGALAVAHRHGVLHRDVKPANTLIDRYGAVKLSDFGLAKQYGDPGQTQQGVAVGTVFYMAPEQVRGLSATDGRADLYSVGVMLYEMLTGRKPFTGADPYAVMRAQMEIPHIPVTALASGLHKGFDSLLETALQKDPAFRFQSAEAFLVALQSIPVQARAAGGFRRYAPIAAGLGAILLAAFAVPPALNEIPLEAIPLSMPAPPAAPAEAFQIPIRLEEPRPSPQPTAIPVKRPRPLPPATPGRAAASFRSVELPAALPILQPPPPLLPPPPVAIPEPVPSAMPTVRTDLPSAKPGNWMRRNFGRVPRLFRRRNSQPDPQQ